MGVLHSIMYCNRRRIIVAFPYTCSCRNVHIYAGYIPTQWTTDARNDKDARRKTQEDFFNNILPLTLLQGFEKVLWGLRVRWSWRPNITEIFWPHCHDRHVVSFLFSWCSTGGLGAHSAGWSATSYQQLLRSPKLHRGSRGPPRPSVAFPTTSRLQLSETLLATPLAPLGVELNWNRNSIQLPRRTQLSYIIVRRPLDLWNRMFNRHQAEITVMQFRGHSFPVHHSVMYHGNFFC